MLGIHHSRTHHHPMLHTPSHLRSLLSFESSQLEREGEPKDLPPLSRSPPSPYLNLFGHLSPQLVSPSPVRKLPSITRELDIPPCPPTPPTPQNIMAAGYHPANAAMASGHPVPSNKDALQPYGTRDMYPLANLDSALASHVSANFPTSYSRQAKTPDSQRTFSSRAVGSSQSSPTRQSLNAKLTIPSTIQAPQQDLAVLAAEVS